jgi:hypothetical protein
VSRARSLAPDVVAGAYCHALGLPGEGGGHTVTNVRRSNWQVCSPRRSFARTSVEKTVIEAAKGIVFEHKRQDGAGPMIRICGF